MWGFEHFRAQVATTFKDLDISKFKINAKEGSTMTMMRNGAEQGVDNAAY